MSHSELAIAGLYDHQQDEGRRAPDWGGDDVFADPRRHRFERPAPQPEAPTMELAPATPAVAEPAPRRTVVITGRPEGEARRPARTIDERIAHRPERIASWTCALGALSILLAIVTAQ